MKINTIEEIQISANDCGSTGVQIYYLTRQINKINDHLKLNHKDHRVKRALMVLIGKRNRLSKYYKKRYGIEKYTETVIDKIGLRK